MNYKYFLQTVSVVFFISMLLVTTWASLHENVFAGGAKILAEPWGVATLFDTYFSFLFFYFWVFYKESTLGARAGWLLGILLLGNFAMATYLLIQIRKLKANEPIDRLLLKN